MGRQLLLEDTADRREVFWVSNINLEEGLPIPLSASDSVALLSLCDQCVQVVEYFQGLFMRLADVLTHMTDHARRAGNEQVGPGDGWPQGGSCERRAARTIDTRILVRAHLPRILDMRSRLPSRQEMDFQRARHRPNGSPRRQGSREVRKVLGQGLV